MAEISDVGARGSLIIPTGHGFLTELELEAMDATSNVARLLFKIIGDGPASKGDRAEMVDKVHQLQSMILAQAASRAYPDRFRKLGG